MLGKIEGRTRRGLQRMRRLEGITDSMDMFKQTPGDRNTKVQHFHLLYRKAVFAPPQGDFYNQRISFYDFINLLFLAVLNLLCCMDFSLVAPSRGYSDCSAWASHSCSSYCGTGASLLLACEIHPDRSSNLCPLH